MTAALRVPSRIGGEENSGNALEASAPGKWGRRGGGQTVFNQIPWNPVKIRLSPVKIR